MGVNRYYGQSSVDSLLGLAKILVKLALEDLSRGKIPHQCFHLTEYSPSFLHVFTSLSEQY